MPFLQKDGRFHFLFLNREDDYISESLRVIGWKMWIWTQAFEAGYRRIIFAEPSMGSISCSSLVRSGRESATADWQAARAFLGALLKKADSAFKSMLAAMDSKGSVSLSDEDFLRLIEYMLAQEDEGKTAFVLPVSLFAGLYSGPQYIDRLKEAASHNGTVDPQRSGGSVFLLTASLDAEDSFSCLADRNGVFASELFPEMSSYVWAGTKPGCFYQRMQDVFTGKRMVCKDPLDRRFLYLLLMRKSLSYADFRLDMRLFHKELDSLYTLLHSRGWGRVLENLKSSSTCRDIPLPAPGGERPLHGLLELAERADLFKLLKWSVEVFEEKYPDQKSIWNLFADDELPDQVLGLRPGLKAGSVTEFEVLKKSASSYGALLDDTARSRMQARLDKIEKYLYMPWESSFDDPDPETGSENHGDDDGLVPLRIREAVAMGSRWLNSYRDLRFDSCDSILQFLERLIVRKPDERRQLLSGGGFESTKEKYSQLTGLELAAADAKARLRRFEKDGSDMESELLQVIGRVRELEDDNPQLKENALLSEDNPFRGKAEREYQELTARLTDLDTRLQENGKMQELIRAQYTGFMRDRDQLLLLLNAVGSQTGGVELKKVDELIRELKRRMKAQPEKKRTEILTD